MEPGMGMLVGILLWIFNVVMFVIFIVAFICLLKITAGIGRIANSIEKSAETLADLKRELAEGKGKEL